MSSSEIKLPSNQKFGFFFTIVFAVAAILCYFSLNIGWTYAFVTTSFVFLIVTLVKSDALLPLNKLWMRFGLFIGIIVSPIVLGIIFFGMFTPISILLRTIGRDELRLKFSRNASHWIIRREPIKSDSFKKQF